MKVYEIRFDADAQFEAIEAAEYIARDSKANARRWYDGLAAAIASLKIMPQRCARAPECETLGQELRHYLYKSHRVIFRIEEDEGIVRILHVRHGAMRPLGESGNDN